MEERNSESAEEGSDKKVTHSCAFCETSQCKQVWYCGVHCQRRHWKTHKKECREYRDLWSNIETISHVDNSSIQNKLDLFKMSSEEWDSHMRDSVFLGYGNS